MIKLLEDYLQEWRTKKEILAFLDSDDCGMRTRIGERALRNYFEEVNERYKDHAIDFYIAHSNKGYRISRNKREIRHSGFDNIKQGANLINKGKSTLRAIGENENMDMLDMLIADLEDVIKGECNG